MGCHGALNGLRVASALAQAHPGANVLLCAVEICSLHHQYTDDPQQIVANSLFADGAAAAIVRSSTTTNGQPVRMLELASQRLNYDSWLDGCHELAHRR